MNPIGVDSADVVVRPLSGPGVIARADALVLVCEDYGAGVEDLLAALAAVAGNGGDGNALVRRVSALLASDEDGDYPACAVAGPVADGRIAVLVHKAAMVTAETESGLVELSGVDAITSVDRLIPGPVSTLSLHLPDAGGTDPRLRLDGGVVLGAGVLVEVASPLIFQPDPASSRPSAGRSAPARPSAGRPAPPPEPAVIEVAEVVVEPAAVEPAAPPVPPPPPPPPPRPVSAPVVPAEVVAEPEPFRVEPPALPDPYQAEVPTPALASVATEPRAAESEQSRLSFMRDRDDLPSMSGSSSNGGEPAAAGPGALTLDDGTTFPLDSDYLVGRDPRQDPEVIAGVVKSLRVADPDGVISRRHARITVVAGQVRVFDLGSANGTFMELPGDPQRHRLTAGEPTVLTAGARVILGRRWLRYDP
ncbi:FHA domain-containing protein [Luedemannella helvata]|uniref:FHA domain-containing protein n=1 Tax=Luedemannella helvata TaxID=349315 RepID=A0ABP4X2A8_9ACTN